MKLNLMNILAAGVLPLALCNCTTTVAHHVPAARGTATGDIKVDALTSVATQSRIVPGCVTPTCAPGRTSLASAAPWTTSNEGITVTTNRLSKVEGFNQVASGVGNLAQGAGVLTLGIGAVNGKLGTRVNNSSYSSSRSGVHLGGCANPDSPYIYGY
jgi:hypothetical protein